MKKLAKIFISAVAVILVLVITAVTVAFSGFNRDEYIPFNSAQNEKQNEITEATPLLKEDGTLTQLGYCVNNLYEYDRSAVKTNPLRIKEWDFYQFCNERYFVQVCIGDISMAGYASLLLCDMQTGERYEIPYIKLFTFGDMELETNAMQPHTLSYKNKKFDLNVDVVKNHRYITLAGTKGGVSYTADLDIRMMDGLETITTATPFTSVSGKYFYLNNKFTSMPVSGTVTIGDLKVEFDPSDTFCCLDWGRGVWPYAGDWYWGNGTSVLEDGTMFGFEITWGFGDASEVTGNMMFIDGKAQKLGEISVKLEKEGDWMSDWIFTSSDGRFEMTMTPYYDNYTKTRVIFVGNICHQVFGYFNGYVILDDASRLEIKDMFAFCEYSDNRW